jgi:hypothetical protein
MKFIFSITYFFIVFNLNAQVYIYTPFPVRNQVLQRDEQDSSAIQIEGVYDSNTIQKLSLQILKDGVLIKEKSITDINPNGVKYNFNLKIKAGKFNYTIQLIANNTEIIKKSENVLSGDLYLFYGQSNALANAYIDDYNPKQDLFSHVLIQTDWNQPTGFWSPVVSNTTYLNNTIGTFALEFAKQITSTSNYPVGIIQCAIGSKDITELTVASDKPNEYSPYDKLTKSLELAQAKNNLKYIMFMQGESDAPSIRAIRYAENFDILYKKLNKDIPNLSIFFNIQINIMLKGFSANSKDVEIVREFQRVSASLYPKIINYSSVGITEFDGLHFLNAGYTKMGKELANMASNVIYKTNTNPNVFSPNIKRIEKNKDGTQLTLTFDESQQMFYPKDTTISGNTRSLKNYIFIDGNNSIIKSGYANLNQIFLNIEGSVNPKFITYLPPYLDASSPPYSTIVNLTNSSGLRAFSFANNKIESSFIKVVILNSKILSDGNIRLDWNNINGALFHLERSINNLTFEEIATTISPYFNDMNVQATKNYYYRIWYETKTDLSATSPVKNISFNCLNNSTIPIVHIVNTINTPYKTALESSLNLHQKQLLKYSQLNQPIIFKTNTVKCK